jgi:hypothetical protein
MNLFDSAIEYKTNNSRAVSGNGLNSMNRAFKIDRNGNLWAAFYVNRQNINVYYSSNNGFTWDWLTQLQTFTRTGTIEGDVLHFYESTALGKIYLATSAGWIYEIDKDNLEMEPEVSGLSVTRVVQFIPSTMEYLTSQEAFNDQIYSMCGDLDDIAYLFYSTPPSNTYLRCSEISVVDSNRETIVANYAELRSIYTTETELDASAKMDSLSVDGYCYVAYADNSDVVKFVKYNRQTHSFGSPTTVATASYHANDPTIMVDGDGNILIAFVDVDGSATSATIRFYISNNDGDNWNSFSVLGPAGTTVPLDAATSEIASHIDAIGGSDGGFLLSSIFMLNGIPTLYVRSISSTGTQGDWKVVNTRNDKPVTGAQFFRPFGDRLPYLGDYSNIRMAYQVGYGDNTYGDDSVLTSVFQERLSSNAYPPDTDTTTYGIDPISSGTLRVEFRVIGSFKDNIDYYDSNIVGEYTDSYIEAIDKIGIPIKINSYEPIEVATDTGKGAYAAPTQYTTKVLIDPQTYDFPTIAKENDVFTQFIERDIRKVFVKPDFFMGRTFVLNDGGFLKRTVWTLYYLGNEYEISQIVPRFIDNQICFYEANVYVIGPSNDPFRKLTLPSET